MPDPSQFNIDRTDPGRRTVTFSNPPINMFVPATIVELGALMTDLEVPDSSVKRRSVPVGETPIFSSPISTYPRQLNDLEVLGLWRDFVCSWRLSSTPVCGASLQDSRPHARYRQRVRAGLRHALRRAGKAALFGNSEIGVADWSRAAERWNGSRAWSADRGHSTDRAQRREDDFDADVAERLWLGEPHAER